MDTRSNGFTPTNHPKNSEIITNEIATIRNILVGRELNELIAQLGRLDEDATEKGKVLQQLSDEMETRLQSLENQISERLNQMEAYIEEHVRRIELKVIDHTEVEKKQIKRMFLEMGNRLFDDSPE